MLEFTKTTVEIKIEDKIYNVRVPTYKESIDYRSTVKGLDNDEVALYEALCSYFEKLGLPKEVTANLEIGHLNQILDFMVSGKKK